MIPCVGCARPVTCDAPLAPVVCAACIFWTTPGRIPQRRFVHWQQRDVYMLANLDRINVPDPQMMTVTLTSGGKITSPRFVCLGIPPGNTDLTDIEHVLLEYTPDALAGVS